MVTGGVGELAMANMINSTINSHANSRQIIALTLASYLLIVH